MAVYNSLSLAVALFLFFLGSVDLAVLRFASENKALLRAIKLVNVVGVSALVRLAIINRFRIGLERNDSF